MFPQYDKAIYIDSDIIVQGDISKLYETDISKYFLGACHEQAMEQVDVYGTYAEKVVGVSRHEFFNAGMMLLNTKEFRNNNGITQLEASKIVGMPLRTYVNYENDLSKSESLKYKMIFSILMEKFKVDEEHGVLKLDYIIKSVGEVLKNYKVEFCYLFGSYAKDKASEDSDIDLLIQTVPENL